MAKNERIVFVIDELPYLVKSEPSITSMLQHLLDHEWSDSKLYLILCGSSMSFMEKKVLSEKSPPGAFIGGECSDLRNHRERTTLYQ